MFIYKILEKIFSKTPKSVNTEKEEENPFPITAVLINENDNTYKTVTELEKAIRTKDVKNIALTGLYGSGKSSVIKTLINNFPNYNYLNLSLATIKYSGSDNCNNDIDKKDNESINQLIEYSILQQIMYKESTECVSQSRFKRIKNLNSRQSLILSLLIAIFFICLIVLFEPKWLSVVSFKQFLSIPDWIKFIIDLICVAIIIDIAVGSIRAFITSIYNSKLNKINIKDGEIDICETTSIFNKHLDEILYFFEATPYDVVIIEDLDRFDTTDIFLKLRELNLILNESKAISRTIKFVYAVRDDVFSDSSRTKFFDYIIPVIPHIDSSNSCDKLLEKLNHEISKENCYKLGIFIDDMRMLNNIVNEYLQYKEIVSGKDLKQENLLAMIIYKNQCPKDFSDLYKRKGQAYEILNSKGKYISEVLDKINEQIKEINKEIDVCETIKLKNRRELRTLYLCAYTTELTGIKGFYINDDLKYIKDFIDNEEYFNQLVTKKINYYCESYGKTRMSINFSEIEKRIDPNNDYNKRLQMCDPNYKYDLEFKKRNLEKDIDDIQNKSLKEVLIEYSPEQFYIDIRNNKLLEFLLINGFIDESYYLYISHFYPGTMTTKDMDFVKDVLTKNQLAFSRKIDDCKTTIEHLRKINYHGNNLLNFDLINYLNLNKAENPEYHEIIKIVKVEKRFDFIKEYYLSNNYQKDALSDFITIYNFWSDFEKTEQYHQDKNTLLEILLMYVKPLYTDWAFDNSIKPFFEDSLALIAKLYDKIQPEVLAKIISNLKIKFTDIDNHKLNKELLITIINGGNYKLTYNNLLVALKQSNPQIEHDFNTCSYTSILNCGDKHIKEYVEINLSECLRLFPPTSTQEDEETMISIINNNSITEKDKAEYLTRQEYWITDINFIQDSFKDFVLDYSLIEPSWNNIIKYFKHKENIVDGQIVKFIIDNIDKISKEKISSEISDENLKKEIFVKLLGTNVITSIEAYKLLTLSFDDIFIDTDLSQLDKERMLYLIENGFIDFNDHYEFIIHEYFYDLYANYIIANNSKFIDKINRFSLSEEALLKLLQSDRFTNPQKEKIINTVSFLGENKALVEKIVEFLPNLTTLHLSHDVIESMINHLPNDESKLSIIMEFLKRIPYDEAFMNRILDILGGNYKKIASKENPKLIDTPDNKILAEYLKKNSYIRHFKQESGIINFIFKRK